MPCRRRVENSDPLGTRSSEQNEWNLLVWQIWLDAKAFLWKRLSAQKKYLNFGWSIWSHAKCCKLVGFHGCLLFLGSYQSTPKGRPSVECTLFNCRIQRAIFETPERELSQRQRQRLLRLAEQQDLNQQRAFWEEQDVRCGRHCSEEVERIFTLPDKLWNMIAVVSCCSYVTHTSSIFRQICVFFWHETCIYIYTYDRIISHIQFFTKKNWSKTTCWKIPPNLRCSPWSRFLRDAGAELSEHSGAAGTAALLTGVVARIGGTSAFNNYGALTW